ncbi:hypothetical protein FS749_001767 [Ceratobasidium sp. UAMH 11750]|nr:hypothetical protein FS749_001767 [Ceratobasidium sp. UAMH 11750]
MLSHPTTAHFYLSNTCEVLAIYAKITSRTKGYPLKLLIVPASLVISATLFFAAFEITRNSYGRTPQGARIKYVLWGIAILVEVIAHIVRFQMDIGEGDGIRLRSHGSITERLTNITTIILGEGINAIAGTFYAIEKEPAPDGPVGAAIVCCIAIEFFLAYLYFNGAAPLKSVRRRAAWVMMHFPWLLTVILLLEGVKNQLLLQSFMASSGYMQAKIATNIRKNVHMDQSFNATMRPILLQGGMSYEKEYGDLMHMIRNQNVSSNLKVAGRTRTGAIKLNETMGVWYFRLQLKGVLKTYRTFMGNDSIPDPTQNTIDRYLGSYSYTLEDYHSLLKTGGNTPHFFQIMNELTGPNFNNIHYIMAMCGGTFITLASLNLIQSWPRDCFRWASIFSRYAVGIIMILLLLLNLGKSQVYFGTPTSQLAGTLRWLDADMVLPTLALAYAVQFIIDTVLVYLAVRSSRKLSGHSSSEQLELGLPAIASSLRRPTTPVLAPVQAQAPAPNLAPASASVAALVQAAPISTQALVPPATLAYTFENGQKKAELVVMDERDVKTSNTSEHIMKEGIAKHSPGAAVYDYSQPPASPDQYSRPGDRATVYDWDQGPRDQGVGVLQLTQNPIAYTHQQQQAQRQPQLPEPQYNYSYNGEPKSPDQQPHTEPAARP